MPFEQGITDQAGLRRVYREPHKFVHDKQIDHIDAGAREYIAASPFVIVSTAGERGVDASPRGGPPGFVTVLDEKRLAIGDLAGNNRLDSFGNVVERPGIGLLFLIPGMDETLRLNGRATVTVDPDVLEACRIDGRLPRVALGVDVEECYLHCAKAFRRSGLWDPASWAEPETLPSAAAIWRGHLDMDFPAEALAADLEVGYRATMWEMGGEAKAAEKPGKQAKEGAAEAVEA